MEVMRNYTQTFLLAFMCCMVHGAFSTECPRQSKLLEKSGCTGTELSITCSQPNQILVIVSAYYSYYDLRDRRCYFSAGHCSTYSSREVYKKCNFKPSCNIRVVEKRSTLCQSARSRYLTILYRCRTVECPDLQPPPNGVLSFTGNSRQYGSLARFTCDTGFTLAGTGTRVCQENCSWSGIQPMCSIPPAVCPVTDHPIHSYGNYCYELRPELLSYPLAIQACVDSHGTLASVDTPELLAFLAWLAEKLLTGAAYWVTTRQGAVQEIARNEDKTWTQKRVHSVYFNMFICQYGPYDTYTPDMLDRLPNRGFPEDETRRDNGGDYPPLNVTDGGVGQGQEEQEQDSGYIAAIVFAVLLGLLSVVLLIILLIFIRKQRRMKSGSEGEVVGDGSSWDECSINGGAAYMDPQTLHSTQIRNGSLDAGETERELEQEPLPRVPTKKLSVQNIKALLYAQVRKIRKPHVQRDGYDDVVIQVQEKSPTKETVESSGKSPVIGSPTNPFTTNTVRTISVEAAAAAAAAGIACLKADSGVESTSKNSHEYAVPVDTKPGSPYDIRNFTDESGVQYDEVPREDDYHYQDMPSGQESDDQVTGQEEQEQKQTSTPIKKPHGQAKSDSTKMDFKYNDLYYDTSE